MKILKRRTDIPEKKFFGMNFYDNCFPNLLKCFFMAENDKLKKLSLYAFKYMMIWFIIIIFVKKSRVTSPHTSVYLPEVV